MLGLGLSLPRRVAFGRPIWTPAALFAQGQQGVWYEPKPEYLYQDAAGTVPVTADGDRVRLMLDISGNGSHATAPSDAARPLYRTDGVLHWLQFDGVDDVLLVPLSFGGSRTIIAGLGEAASTAIAYGGRPGASKRSYLSRSETGQVRGGVGEIFSGFESTSIQGNVVATLLHEDQNAQLQVNGEIVDTQAFTEDLSAGSPSYIGALWDQDGSTNQLFEGAFFGVIDLKYRALSGGASNAEEYLAKLAGITL